MLLRGKQTNVVQTSSSAVSSKTAILIPATSSKREAEFLAFLRKESRSSVVVGPNTTISHPSYRTSPRAAGGLKWRDPSSASVTDLPFRVFCRPPFLKPNRPRGKERIRSSNSEAASSVGRELLSPSTSRFGT